MINAKKNILTICNRLLHFIRNNLLFLYSGGFLLVYSNIQIIHTRIIGLAIYVIITTVSLCTFEKKIYVNKLTYTILIFFFACSLSILNTINIPSFINLYLKIMLGLMIYFSTIYTIKHVGLSLFLDNIFIVLLSCVTIIVINQLILFYTENTSFIGSPDTIKIALAHLKMNGKLLDDSLLEVTLPFFISNFLHSSRWKKILSLILLIIINLFALFSLFRYRILAIILAYALFIFFENKYRLRIGKLLFIFIFLGFLIIQIINPFTINTFNRIDDVETINWRLDINYELLHEIPAQYMPFGVGLANSYDYLSGFQKQTNSIIQKNALENGPHNLFTQFYFETGIFGLFSLLSTVAIPIIGFFKKKDTNKEYMNEVYYSFFVILTISQFNPSTNFNFFFLFFFLLGVISAY